MYLQLLKDAINPTLVENNHQHDADYLMFQQDRDPQHCIMD